MKRIISLVLSLSIVMSLFGGLDLSVFATSSNTTITISNDFEEHMIGSSFGVSASYKSDTYSHNSETISYEISGPEHGLVLDGGMSCIGTPDNGFISIPFKAVKIGEYIVVLNGPDGATDSIKIIISDKPYDVYLAENILERDKFLSSTDTIMQLSDYGWMESNEVRLYFNDMSVQQYVETMLIRILIGKVIDEKNIYESYAEAASLVTKCMSGIQSIHSSVTEETTFDTINDIEIKNQIKTYINDMYEFDVFDTLSTTINGATTIAKAVKQASYYRVISDVLSAEEISKMFSATVSTIYSSDYENTLILAFNNVIEIITNTDLKISEHFANTAISYGVDSLKSLTLDIAKALALNSLNAVAPGLGTVLSAGMTVYEICKAIDDLCRSKLEAVQINLSALSMFCETFKHAVESHSYNPKENANIIVENYKYLLSANRIAVEIQQENLDILSDNLLKSVTVQPAFSLQQLLKNIDILGGNTDSLYSTYLITERYPVVIDTLTSIVNNEYDYIKTVTEDYLYYSYGMDLFKYTADLWEIETKYVVTLDANFDDSSFSNKQYFYFSKGETLDERTRPHLRSGYEFVGWYTDKECTIEYNTDNAIESNFTLYAKWEKKINYVENEDGTATVTSINPRQSRNSTMQLFSLTRTVDNPTQTAIEQIQAADSIVPLFIDGKSIVSIASNAVSPDCSSIYIPEIVENIENDAIDKSTSIICWPNSYAHRFAESNGYDCVLLNFDGTDENASETFTYAVNDDGYTVTITGLVDNCNPSNLYIPSRINGYTVTAIGYSAFDNLEFLKQVSIPFSISHIGTNAFYNCVNLSTVTLNNGLKSIGDDAFGNCKSLDSIVIPDTVTSLGDCFNDCTGLRELTMPVSAKIYYYEFGYINTTFKNCTNIEKVTLTKGSGIMQNFGDYTCTPWYISGCKEVVISEGVSNISYKAFYDCSSLETVILPNSVTQIDESAFYNCTNLQNITFPSELSSIGRNAFYNCTSIDKIVLPNNLLSISSGAFYGCTSLEQVIVGDNVSQIGNEAFYQCGAITELSLPASATYGSNTFSGCSNINQVTITAGNGQMHTYSDMTNYGNTIFYQYSPWFISGCKKIIINNGVTNISDFAFYNCTSVEHFVLPNSLTTIGNDSFRGCTNLKSIEIPDSVTCIGDYAFFYCPNLLDITFPKTLEELGGAVISETAYINDSTNWTNGALYISDWLYATDEEHGGEYIIESGTKTIGDDAFSYHDTVTKIYIPSSVERIQDTAIYSCTSLREITVDKQNGFYSSENGMLFNKEKTELICCPNKKGICSIPSGVIKIRDWAFSSCNFDLTELVIPISVKEIGYYAISSNSLQHIFYEGNENEWSYISGTSNAFIQDSEKHYNYSVCTIFEETCFDYGAKEFECPHCGYKKSETILPIGHSFANGICLVCGRLKEDCIESSHNYSNNCDDAWIISKPNASYITVTFSASTETEYYCDYIYIYDMNDNLIGQYSGTELASQTITVIGNIVKIRLTSDSSVNKYGFAVSDICSYIKSSVNDVEVAMPENAVDSTAELRVDEIDINHIVVVLPEEFDTETANVYDIYFEKDEQRVQPNGAVTVYIPVPSDMDGEKCKVFHIDEFGNATDMNAVYADGYMVLITEHFSYYALMEKEDKTNTSFKLGDINGDGEIDQFDYILVKRAYFETYTLKDEEEHRADVNCDGKIDQFDYILIKRHYFGTYVIK